MCYYWILENIQGSSSSALQTIPKYLYDGTLPLLSLYQNQRHYTKRKLQTYILTEHECKISQQNTSK